MKNYPTLTPCKLLLLLCFAAGLTPARGQWSQTNGPLGQNFFDMLRHNGRIWGAAEGGLFYSDNEGESWKHHPDFSYDDYEYSVIKHKDKLYTVVERGVYGPSTPLYSLFSSSDNGQSWQEVNSLPSTGGWPQVHVYQNNLLLTGGYKPYFSLDEGASWQILPLPLPSSNWASFVFDSSTLVAWYNQKGVFATQDFGQHWITVADSTENFTDVLSVRNDEIIARKSLPTAPYWETNYSQNLGQSWALLSDPFPDTIFYTSYFFWGKDTIVASHPAQDGHFEISLDEGASWLSWTEWGTDGFLPQIVTNDGALSGTTKFYTSTGATAIRNEGLVNQHILDIKSNGDKIFAHTYGGIYSSNNDGDTWEHLPLDDRLSSFGEMAVSGDTVFLCRPHVILYATNNGLSGWDTLTVIGVHSLYELRVYGDHLIVEDDNLGISLVNRNSGQITDVSTPVQDGDFYEIGDRYVMCDDYDPIVWISDNKGQTWAKKLDKNDTGCRMLFINGQLMLCTRTTTFLSSDQGSSWTDIGSNGLPDNPWGWGGYALPGEAVVLGSTIYANFPDYGVYQTNDFGANWQPFNDNLGALRSDCFTDHKGTLFLGTPTSGVWRNASANSPVKTPVEVEKLLVEPNPSTGQFRIQWPMNSPAEVRFYNAMGQLLWQKKVADGAAQFDLEDYPQGVYRLELVSSGRVYKGTVVFQR